MIRLCVNMGLRTVASNVHLIERGCLEDLGQNPAAYEEHLQLLTPQMAFLNAFPSIQEVSLATHEDKFSRGANLTC